jgi:selenide, water dikinase
MPRPAAGAARHAMQHTLVLVGGGHAHVQLVASSRPYPPLARRLLISDDPVSVYSGMLPAIIAGLLPPSEADVHLRPLAARFGWDFLAARVTAISAADRTLTAVPVASPGDPSASRPAPITIRYTALSLDIGSTTKPPFGPLPAGAPPRTAVVVPTRPIRSLLARLRSFEVCRRASTAPLRVVVVGCGKAGVELVLALHARLRASLPLASTRSFAIVAAAGAQHRLEKQLGAAAPAVMAELRSKGIVVHAGRRAVDLQAGELVLAGGARLPADLVVLATGPAAHAWVRDATDLEVDDDGFVVCTPALRTRGFAHVFAAGDCAGFGGHFGPSMPPRAGVYAVRAGPVLERNLRAVLAAPVREEASASLEEFAPQATALALLSLGDRERTIGTKGKRLVVSGPWVYNLKMHLDRRWLARFRAPSSLPSDGAFGGDEGADPAFSGTPVEAAAALFADTSSTSGDFGVQHAVLRRMDREPDFADRVHASCRQR